jgi:hypothetical protein
VQDLADAAHASGGWESLVGSSKLQALVRLLHEEVGPHEKAVIFTRFGADAVAATCNILRKSGIGAVSLKERAANGVAPVEVFRTSSECRALVLHADTSAAGLTLTCARHVIFLDVLFSPTLESQARARVARIGQTAETTAWHLVAENTIDTLLRDAADRQVPFELGDESPSSIGWMLRAATARSAMPRTASATPLDGTDVDGGAAPDALPSSERAVREATHTATPESAPRTITRQDAAADVGVSPHTSSHASSKRRAKDEHIELGEAAAEAAADPMLGRRIDVWWTGMRCWYAGEVVAMQRERGHKVHEVLYEADGAKCWHRLEDGPRFPGSLPGPPKSKGLVRWKPAGARGWWDMEDEDF